MRPELVLAHAEENREPDVDALRAAGVPVWTINYGGIPLGVGAGLTAPGVQYQASRIVAAACEGVSMYCALRRVIFAPRPTPGPQRS